MYMVTFIILITQLVTSKNIRFTTVRERERGHDGEGKASISGGPKIYLYCSSV